MVRGAWIAVAACCLLAPAALAIGWVTLWNPHRAPPVGVSADRILIEKAARRLTLLRDGTAIAVYPISLGFSPKGHKTREGDGRTPEGTYTIDWRNPNSAFHLSLHISYPRPEDQNRAQALGVPPGGHIMIHGLPNAFPRYLAFLSRLHILHDWTAGCIAVTDEQIEEIWHAVPDGTPVEIRA